MVDTPITDRRVVSGFGVSAGCLAGSVQDGGTEFLSLQVGTSVCETGRRSPTGRRRSRRISTKPHASGKIGRIRASIAATVRRFGQTQSPSAPVRRSEHRSGRPGSRARPSRVRRAAHCQRLLRDLAQDRRPARLGPGVRRDARIRGCPSVSLVWLYFGLRPRRTPCEERLERGLFCSK